MATIACVGAVVLDAQGRLLLVLRANEPARGTWSLPGGRVEPGEDDATAVAREVAEETGLRVDVGTLAGACTVQAPRGGRYLIHDYRCSVAPGADHRARAGDDAADVGWFTREDLPGLATSPGLLDLLAEWKVLPH